MGTVGGPAGEAPGAGGGCGLIGKSRFLREPAVKLVLERPCLGRAPAPEPTAGIVCSGGGRSVLHFHPTAAGAGCRAGAKPHHHCYGLPGVPSSSLARGTGNAEQGCGDRASGICRCLASATPVGPQLIPSLQLPNPFGFVVGFYFFLFIYFPFVPSRTRTAHRQ